MLYPTQLPAVPDPIPIEARATACNQAEVTGLTVDRSGNQCELCWNAPADCVDGYRIKGASSPDLAGNFSDLASTTSTCVTLDPAQSYFLVVGTVGQPGGSEGPWGHFGQ